MLKIIFCVFMMIIIAVMASMIVYIEHRTRKDKNDMQRLDELMENVVYKKSSKQ